MPGISAVTVNNNAILPEMMLNIDQSARYFVANDIFEAFLVLHSFMSMILFNTNRTNDIRDADIH